MCINDPTPSLFLRIVFSPVSMSFFPLYPYQEQSFIRNSRLLYLVLKYKPISNFHCGCCHLFRAKSEKSDESYRRKLPSSFVFTIFFFIWSHHAIYRQRHAALWRQWPMDRKWAQMSADSLRRSRHFSSHHRCFDQRIHLLEGCRSIFLHFWIPTFQW